MDSPFKAASASAAEPLGPLTGRTAASRQTTHVVADSREWRDGYRRHLIAKSVPPHEAADLAAKVAFRPDLFPFPHAVPHLARAQAEQAIETRCSEVVQHTQPKRLNKLLAAAHEIATIPPTGNDFVLTHAVLCQVGLPRSKVEGREFHRRSGDMWINVQAGWLDEGRGPVAQPIPYGAMPRLALAMISTLARRYKTREVPIGESAAQFLKLMGMDDQKNRYVKLREQMHALAACRLQIGYRGRTFSGQPVDQFDAWMGNADTGQKALWPGVLVLSEHYYNELVEHGVPLDKRALVALKGSALALDIYTWLAHRLHRIEGRPITLHWKPLRQQFAQESQSKDADRDFKKAFLPALRQALAVYPEAKVKPVKGGLLLMASPPPIPPKNAA
ncbi:replication protein RepA [Verminephrobacter eiseniae]|uniref:replication protein RepA n=1 Tax=Verminephrobacter eiseniae TaxID=364317 RepID=UPI002ADDE71C|nr:replication protein RepA [Verminephrobacter eiseniae]